MTTKIPAIRFIFDDYPIDYTIDHLPNTVLVLRNQTETRNPDGSYTFTWEGYCAHSTVDGTLICANGNPLELADAIREYTQGQPLPVVLDSFSLLCEDFLTHFDVPARYINRLD